MTEGPGIFDREFVDSLLNRIRKWRTRSLKIAFPLLIMENVLTGDKPRELCPWEGVSAVAVIGAILVLAGALLRLWARGHFQRGRLFKSGPYGVVRHPLYLGSFLIVVGVLCQLNDWVNWVVIIPLFALFYGSAIIYEERSLEKRFGRQWQRYKSRVPAFIPWGRGWPSKARPYRWQWNRYLRTGELITTLMILSIPFLIELLKDFVFEGVLGI